MNVAVYARVSTDIQAEKGYSLETQVEACKTKAIEMGASSVKEYIDDGYSGAYLERPALESLRDAIHLKMFDKVIVYDADRLSRKLSHQLLLTEEIENSGAELVFVLANYDKTPEGQLFYQIRGAFSDYEREKIRERTMRGKRGKMRSGKVVEDSHVYGYDFDKENSCYVINEIEANTIRKIHNLYTIEKYGGCLPIAKFLNQDTGMYPPPMSSKWTNTAVMRILNREMYTGKFYANKLLHRRIGIKKEQRIERPKSEWIEMKCPQIISNDLYKQTAEQVRKNKTRTTYRNCSQFYLLQGLVYCGLCGRRLSITSNAKKIRYYKCYDYTAEGDKKKCQFSNRGGDVRFVDDIFWEVLERICVDVPTVKKYIKTDNALVVSSEHKKNAIEKKINRLQIEKQAVMNWFGQSLLTQDEATDKLAKIKKEEIRLTMTLNSFSSAQEKKRLTPEEIIESVHKCLDDKESRKAVVQKIIKKVTFVRKDTGYGRESYAVDFDITFN